MALDIISTINLDLKRPNTETVYAVQYDTAGRIKAQLTNDGEAWHVPTSAGGMVSFRKSDNIGGFYDTTELGEVAVSVDENDDSVIYIALDAQTTVTATPLDHPVQMQINFYNSQGKRLSTFAFYLRVQASVLFDGDQDERPVASEWTFRILTGALGQTIKNQEDAIKWMADNIRTQAGYVVDDTLKVPGAAGDAKKIGELFEEIVKISDSMPGYFPTTDTARVGSTKYYTRSGTAPNYVYTEFTGATFATGVTYYEYSPWNRIWIDPDDNDIEIPTMDEFDEVKSAFTYKTFNDLAIHAKNSHYFNLVWTSDKRIAPDGTFKTLSGCSATEDYYPVKTGDIVQIHVHAPGSSDVCAFYDKHKTFKSSFTVTGNDNYSFTAAEDGFLRFSNEPNVVSEESAFVLLTNANYKSIEEIEDLFVDVYNKIDEIAVGGVFNLQWTDNKYLRSSNGKLGTTNNFASTEEYYPVFKGQILKINLYANSTDEAAVAFYDTDKVYHNKYEIAEGVKYVTVPDNGYARFSTRVTQVSKNDAYVNVIDVEKEINTQKFFTSNENADVGNETPKGFVSEYIKDELPYTGEVTPAKRYLAIGFDDFRDSDFSSIIPIFNKYRGNATFNKVATGADSTLSEKEKISTVVSNLHEIGDHTILHYAFPYTNANFNGQNPTSADGNQMPYPTNAMMREDAGSGNNAFGLALTSAVNISGCSVTANWGDLTDAQCQTIRESFSVLKNATFAPLIDSLSNKYLGTSGTSAGSYDSETGRYTEGIFTGCETSENHEVWERILTIVQLYYKDQFGLAFNFKCWSLPGTNGFNYGLLYDSKKYYDTDHEKLFNMNARFTSSLTGETRSFAEVLEQFGYLYTHDFNYPGRLDGGSEHMINKQFIINANLSRKNGIVYPTNRTINYANISAQYPSTFFTDGIPKGQQMYEVTGTFKTFVEALRTDTARGIIRGEVIDSDNSYSMRTFFDELLKFCKINGIEVITKSQANDICFNHPVRTGNLLYNPLFENSIKKAYPNASNIPSTPDGISGNCEVYKDSDGTPILKTTAGTDIYISQYGIPLGKLKLKVDLKNNAASQYMIVYAIKNSDPYYFLNANDHILATAYPSSNDWATFEKTFVIPDVDETVFDQNYSGMGDKICGIYIRFSGKLEIKNMSLTVE